MSPIIGWVGIGAMGAPMIGHLLRAGHAVRVHSRRPEAARELIALGASFAPSATEAALGAAVFCTNVTSTADVESVLFGEHGAVSGLAPGAIVIDFSTISATATRQMAQRLADQGVLMLDCPVSGGAQGARDASLSIMVGGESSALERVRPILECLGKTITHIGPSGDGQVAKACNQVVQVVNIQAIAEALMFAQRNGTSAEKVLAAMQTGMAGSRMLDLMGPRMVKRHFEAGIEARLHQKDFGLVAAIAARRG